LGTLTIQLVAPTQLDGSGKFVPPQLVELDINFPTGQVMTWGVPSDPMYNCVEGVTGATGETGVVSGMTGSGVTTYIAAPGTLSQTNELEKVLTTPGVGSP